MHYGLRPAIRHILQNIRFYFTQLLEASKYPPAECYCKKVTVVRGLGR